MRRREEASTDNPTYIPIYIYTYTYRMQVNEREKSNHDGRLYDLWFPTIFNIASTFISP
jgi:hypothetical protein